MIADLSLLGWDDAWQRAWSPHAAPGVSPARVAVAHRDRYVVLDGHGAAGAIVSGRFRHDPSAQGGMPAVGDWVAVEPRADGDAIILRTLPRRSLFERRAAHSERRSQVVAANVDVVFVVTSLNRERNARRIERYLALAWESGAVPVVVLSKSDLEEDPALAIAELAGVAPGVEVIATSVRSGAGLDALRANLPPGRTGALLGSSGVGKSSLVNALLGEERFRVAEVRDADAKGRHTTSHRELVTLPWGALLIDTPGMRELGMRDAADGIEAAFSDIATLAGGCRYRDCRHEQEPGCAVLAAVAEGALHVDRLDSFRRLVREQAHYELAADPLRREEAQREVRAVHRAMNALKRGR